MWPRLRTSGWVLLLLSSLALLWGSPQSPVALERGDVLFGQGELALAAEHFDSVAQHSPWARLRRSAAMRSAALWSVDLNEPLKAQSRLGWVVQDEGAPAEQRAQAASLVGDLQFAEFDDPAGAAVSYEQAYAFAKDSQNAGERLADQARALEASGEVEEAHRTWEAVVRNFKGRRAEARINQAALLLGQGQLSQALELYEDAISAAADDTHLYVARLGAAACRDRQQRIEQALAEIESGELSDDLREIRRAEMAQQQDGNPL
jgi:tetratricopeptide (TPR) repeat protein